MPLYYCLENDIEGAENMSENGKDKIRGIRIRTVSYTMIFLSIVLYLVLLYATRQVSCVMRRRRSLHRVLII